MPMRFYTENALQFLSLLPPPTGLTVDIGCGEGRFDRTLRHAAQLVVSFMALHDIADLEATCREARRVLAPGGGFSFSIIHPVSGAGDFDEGERFVLDNYFPARPITRPLFDTQIVQYHRPLGDYAAALSGSGFVITCIAEIPSQRRAIGRLPMFLHFVAN